MTGDLFEQDAAAQAPCESPSPDRRRINTAENPASVPVPMRQPASRDGKDTEAQPAPAAPVDRTSIEYFARLQHFYRFGAWPPDADQP